MQVRHSVPLRAGPSATLQDGIVLRALGQHVVAASTAVVSVFDVSRPLAGPAHLFEDTVHVIMAAIRMQVHVPAAPNDTNLIRAPRVRLCVCTE